MKTVSRWLRLILDRVEALRIRSVLDITYSGIWNPTSDSRVANVIEQETRGRKESRVKSKIGSQ